MNIIRLSTLSLTLAIAVFALGYANPSFAKGKDCVVGDTRPKCSGGGGGGGDDPVTYEVALEGAFVFGPIEATLEGQDDRLRPVDNAEMIRPNPDPDPAEAAAAAWDHVFSIPDPDIGPCDLFGPTPAAVASFTALKKNKEEHVKGWRVARPGGVYIAFGLDQLLADPASAAGEVLVDVGLQLRGDCAYSVSGSTEICNPFLPDPTMDYGHGLGISRIPLKVFQIHAQALKGDPQFEGCHTAEDNLWVPSTLVITATATTPP